jgi:hypothetical protein
VARTQKIFAIGRPALAVSWEDMVPPMQQEAAHLWSLYEQGIVRGAWVRTDSLGLVYELESTPGQALKLLAGQPLARLGLVGFELIPVGPCTALALLFGTEHELVSPRPLPAWGRPTQTVLAIDTLADDVSAAHITSHLPAEARHEWSLWKAGIVRRNYVRTDRPGAVIELEAEGVTHARELLADLPLVRAGLIAFECQALATFTGYDALLDGSLEEAPVQLRDPTRNFLFVHPNQLDPEARSAP